MRGALIHVLRRRRLGDGVEWLDRWEAIGLGLLNL
jgi:hypothetical protein